MSNLYDTDFYQWTQEQAALLQAGKASALDWANLAEEIDSLGKNDRRGLGSHLQGLIMHLLKWQYQSSGRQTGHSWLTSIDNHRDDITDIVTDSPSLRRQIPTLIVQRYPRARRKASRETGLPLEVFPVECPWTAERVLDDDFLPE